MIRLRVVHTTGYAYAGRALASYNQARLTPLTTPEQIVVHHRIEVSPKPWLYEYRDYFGNQVTAFEVLDPHESLTVTATSTVHVSRSASAVEPMSWEDLRSHDVADRRTEFLVLPALVAPPSDLAALSTQAAAATDDLSAAVAAICTRVAGRIAFDLNATTTSTTAAEAWALQAGVTQDVVHLCIGALRSVGIPARYVSGYVHSSAEPAVGEEVVGQPGAWLEWWQRGWHAWDPLAGAVPTEAYISVATGRDYTDVRPLSGIYTGPGTSRMFVEVGITRLA